MQSKKEQDELIKNGLAILNFNDKNAELSVISTIIKYNEKWEEVSDILTEDVFYDQKNKAVFKCLQGVLKSGGIADIGALSEYSKAHPEKRDVLEYYDFLSYNEVNPIAFEQNVERIVRYWKHRKIWELTQIFANRVQDHTEDITQLITELQENVKNVGSRQNTETLRSMADVAKEAIELFEKNTHGGGMFLKSGYQIIDDAYMLRETTLTIIAAFSAVGKSALAMNIAENVARNGHPVAYYTKEMADVELFMRVVAGRNILDSDGKIITANKLMNANEPCTRGKFEQAVNSIANLPIYFDNGATTTFEKTIRSIRDVVKKKGVQLVVIDYLQIFAQTAEGSDESSLGYMARELKNIAKDLKIAVIALSQISRPAKSNDKTLLHPRMRSLRGSGQLEESADSVLLIDRPEVFGAENVPFEHFGDKPTLGHAEFVISKARAGATTKEWLVKFEGKTTRFIDLYDSGGKEDSEKKAKYEESLQPSQPQQQQMFAETSNNVLSNYCDKNAVDASGNPLPF